MNNQLRYVSSDRLFSKLYRDYGLENRDVDETDVIEYTK